MASKVRRGGAGVATFLLVLGCVSVLGTAFMLGVATGRVWPRFPFSVSGSAAPPAPSKDKADRSAHAPEPTPTLTFYRELTAPLTSPPPAKPPRPARVEKTEGAKPAPAPPLVPTPAVASPVEPSATPEPTSAPAEKDGRFTVQVGAYKAREPAEALRARLAATGHDAYIVDAEGPGGSRFRVRVGAFATRVAAQEFAARIAAERSVSTFVTTR
jgi:cell division protein FtsN